MTIYSGHGSWQAVDTEAFPFAAVGMELKYQLNGIETAKD
jgi:hypothetical protein